MDKNNYNNNETVFEIDMDILQCYLYYKEGQKTQPALQPAHALIKKPFIYSYTEGLERLRRRQRKRNCLKCQFCLFFVSVNVKQGVRPFYHANELIPSKLNRFRYGIHFCIPAGVTSSTHHVVRKILVAQDRNFIHKSQKIFFNLKN